ncbi:MAG: DUF982 domain-containing protein [Pararhizobium sp.]
MSDRLFDPPVFIKDGEYLIREIASLEDAIDVLEEWPDDGRDLIYETVARACRGALDGRRPISVARNGFVGFARRVGILEDTGSIGAWMKSTNPRGSGVAT